MSETSNGKVDIRVSPKVIAQYVGQEAKSCFGIVGMGTVSRKDGYARVLKNDKLDRGVSVTVKDGKINIDFHIIVAYGVSIQAVAENLTENISYQVEQFTGMEVGRINVFVEGVRFID